MVSYKQTDTYTEEHAVNRKKKIDSLTLVPFLFLALSLITCTRESGDSGDKAATYGVIAEDNSGSFNFISVSSLTTGTVSASGTGKSLAEYGDYFGNFFTSDSFLYTTKPGSGGKLLKHKVAQGDFEKAGEVVLKGLMEDTWYNYHLTSKDTASFFGRSNDARFLIYNLVDIRNMKLLSAGNLPLPAPDSSLDQKYIDHGICIVRRNKLYLTYCYCNENWQYKDTTYLAEMDYPSLRNVKISKYTKIGFPLTYGAVPGAVIDKSENIFISGGINDYQNLVLPSGIHKIPGNSSVFSASINAKEKLGADYAVYGIWDLGNGKILTRVAGPWFDEWVKNENTYDLYTVDISTGKFTKLDIPRSVHLGNTILIQDGKVYIAISADNHIYMYDIANEAITKGLQVKDAKRLIGIYSL